MEVSGLQYYGGGVFVLPFSTRMAVEYTYVMERYIAYWLNERDPKGIEFFDSENSTDHDVGASDRAEVQVQGRISVVLDVEEVLSALGTNEMHILLREAQLEIDKLSNVTLVEFVA